MSAIDLAPVVSAFDALVSAVPTRSATVIAAEKAVSDALDLIERNARVLVFEREQQEKKRARSERQAHDDAADLERRKQERADLAARAAAKAKKGSK